MSARAGRRIAARAAAAIALVLATTVVAGAILVLRPLPTIDADLRLLGLHERGEILRDRWGVPHVFARNAHDLFYLQGYATAQDRLFQMDVFRRAGRGRLSEVFGAAALDADRLARTLGLAQAAEADLLVVRDEARAALEAYAEGVNKYLTQHRDSLPLEFVLLGHVPDPWSPTDTLVIGKVQALDLAVNYETELLRLGVAHRLGPEAIATLFPDPDGIVYDDERAWRRLAPFVSGETGSDALATWRRYVGDAHEGVGSNCWVAAGSRTKSGKPVLAVDSHLAVRNPSTWYETALEGAGYKVIGFTIPGVPGIVSGHNDRIAWGLTVAYVDAQDLYVERQAAGDLRAYLYRGGVEPAKTRREEIRVRGSAEPVIHDVVVTRHGPIVTPILKGQSAQLALRWTALDGGRSIDAVLALGRARNWDEFRAALADFQDPALNLCYADVDGHIGVALAGAIPDRGPMDDGRLPAPGWTGEHDWRGIRPARENPAILDPPDGLVISANDRVYARPVPPVGRGGPAGRPVAGDFPAEHDPGFRASRLRELLEVARGADLETFRRLQTDVVSLPARSLREPLLAAAPRSALAATAQRHVRDWDGTLAMDSIGAAVYEAWLVGMIERTFKDKLGETLYREYATYARFAVPALHALIGSRDSPWFSEVATPVRGRDEISALALQDGVERLTSMRGPDPARWRWGDVHQVTFEHPLGGAFGFLNFGPHPRPGDGYTVNAASYRLVRPFPLRGHASLRMVCDMADVEGCASAIPTGQSGQPFDRYWGTQLPLWLAGDLHPMLFSRDRIGEPDGRLVLRAR